MSGFFLVTDIPQRRVVQYKRVAHSMDGAVYINDDSVLGAAVDVMPYADKTGIAESVVGTLYEVAYLPDAGDVYFAAHPMSAEGNADDARISVEVKGGRKPYRLQWYKDDKQVVNVPESTTHLDVSDSGSYFCVATDADGVQAVSQAGVILFTKKEAK